MSGKQQEFNWPRARQLSALRDCRIPHTQSKDGGPVSSGVLKAVLVTIDQFAGQERECFASLDTIAGTAGFSIRHVKRAIEILVERSLITKERRKNRYGVVSNHYRIVWNELALLVPRSQNDQSATVSDQSATVSIPKCHCDTQSANEAQEAQEDMDQIVSCFLEDITGLTARAFLNAGYTGSEGGNIWKAVAALHLGLISEHELWDSCAAAKSSGNDKPAYFYRSLANLLAKRGVEIAALFARIRIQPEWPSAPPAAIDERQREFVAGE